MTTIAAYRKKVSALTSNWQSELEKATDQQAQKQYADELRGQLLQGERGDGQKITPTYRSLFYASDKAKRNPAPGLFTPDLKDTGAFHRSIFAVINSGEMYGDSKDSKAGDLFAKYDEDDNLLTLQEGNRNKVAKIIIHNLLKNAKLI